MTELNLDWTELAALWLASTLIMTALVALALRFAVVPVLDAVARLRAAASAPQEERIAELELRLARLSETVARLHRQAA